jgi:hypothetical protein
MPLALQGQLHGWYRQGRKSTLRQCPTGSQVMPVATNLVDERVVLIMDLVAEVSQVPAISPELLQSVQGSFVTAFIGWVQGVAHWRAQCICVVFSHQLR